MKTKIKALILTAALVLSVFSMSSCYFLSDSFLSGLDSDKGNTEINVQGGNTNNVTINPSDSSNELLAANKALLSSVAVVCEVNGSNSITGESGTYNSLGSGVIYKLDKNRGDAYIITNYHVVHDSSANTPGGISDNIKILLYGHDQFARYQKEFAEYSIPATYVGGSMQYDLALLKISGSTRLMESEAVAATVADSNQVSIFETAIAVGNPEGVGISATAGYINVDSEEIYIKGSDEVSRIELRVMRTDAAVNSGNSGGGLFNGKGELIGIVNAKTVDDAIDNIGYAIPSNVAKAIAENILYYCEGGNTKSVHRVMLGITVTHKDVKASYDTATGRVVKSETVYVDSLTDTSAMKGYIEAGDVINSITIDGVTNKVTRMFHVVDSMLNARPGSTVVMNITRNGAVMDVTVTVTQSMLVEYK